VSRQLLGDVEQLAAERCGSLAEFFHDKSDYLVLGSGRADGGPDGLAVAGASRSD
jgi:hypothetical protein